MNRKLKSKFGDQLVNGRRRKRITIDADDGEEFLQQGLSSQLLSERSGLKLSSNIIASAKRHIEEDLPESSYTPYSNFDADSLNSDERRLVEGITPVRKMSPDEMLKM